MKHLYYLSLLLIGTQLQAQDCAAPAATIEFQVNNILANINSGEHQFNDQANLTAGFEVPAGSGVHTIYANNFWIGGVNANSQLNLAGETYFGDGFDYYNGPLTVDGAAEASPENCLEYDRLFCVYEYQSLAHLEYYNCLNDPNCNLEEQYLAGYTTPDVFYDYPAQGNLAEGQAAYLAPFFDYNEDGLYIPDDGDCPLFSSMLDTPTCATCESLSGHKATFWITNDKGGVHSSSNGLPIGVEMHNVAYGYSSTNHLNDVLFMQKKIINRGSTQLFDTYIGTWTDMDIGSGNDDYLGCDINRNLAYGYNGVNNDAGYGNAPPAMGIKLLSGIAADAPGSEQLGMTGFLYLNSGFGEFSDPSAAVEYYNYMRSVNAFGQPLTFPGTEDPTHWMFAGDTYPNTTETWEETQVPGDRRSLMSSGPFTFSPGDEQCISQAYIYARSEESNLESLEELKLISDEVQADFDNCFDCVPPLADIQIELAGDLTFQFHNVSTADSYSWDFGDGSTSSTIAPIKTFDPTQNYEIIFTLANECGTDSDTLDLSFQPSGIEEPHSQLHLTVFPNPAQESITISHKEDVNLALQIVDMAGRQVLTKTITTNTPIDISELSQGHYILTNTHKNETLPFRVPLLVVK